jgi:hypothetical protein
MKRVNQLIRKAEREGLADLSFSDEPLSILVLGFGWSPTFLWLDEVHQRAG